jgi:hypothetical protein
MNNTLLKEVEHDINAVQAKLHVARAEAKRNQDYIDGKRAKYQIGQIEKQVDQIITEYRNADRKEATNG